MDKNSVVEVGVQLEEVGTLICGVLFIFIFEGCEGVAHPGVYCGHVAGPQGGVTPVLQLQDGGGEREGVLPHTVNNI